MNPFNNRPMLCRNCWKYGHTSKRCKDENPTCQRCGEHGHPLEDCKSEQTKCIHCGGEHKAGDRDCRRQKYEQEVLNVAQREKVSIPRAKQMLENNLDSKIPRQKPKNAVFATHFDCKLDPVNKRKINPFLLERCIQQVIGSKPRTIRTKDSSTFTIQIGTQKESYAMSELTAINNFPCQISVNESLEMQKGLIYIYGYDMENPESFKKALIDQYQLAAVEQPFWIKPKNKLAKPLLLSFRAEMPPFLDIPGEKVRTKVYEYKKQPLLCKKCLDYGHSSRVCHGDERCINCGSLQHAEDCTSATCCFNCKLAHKAGDKACREYKFEEEIIHLQSKLRVAKSQAIAIFNRENPNFRTLNYSESVKRKLTSDQRSGDAANNSRKVHIVPKPNAEGAVSVANAKRREILLDDELTSENNPVVNAESRVEFARFDPANVDMESYETDLRNASVHNSGKRRKGETQAENHRRTSSQNRSTSSDKSSSSKASQIDKDYTHRSQRAPAKASKPKTKI